MAKMKVALVGLAQAKGFVRIINHRKDFEVTALCDIDEALLNQVGDEKGIDVKYTDYNKLMESDAGAVILSTPIQVHGPQAIAALKAGKHVLCQYGASANPKEAEELIKAREDTGKKYMFIETDCYERRNYTMMQMAAKGLFGDLITGLGEYNHLAQINYNADGSLTWRGQLWSERNGGSVVAIHTSTPLFKMFGERVVAVQAMGSGSIYDKKMKRNDKITTLCKLVSGRMIELIHANGLPLPAQNGYNLYGTKGSFVRDKAALTNKGSGLHVWSRDNKWSFIEELEKTHGIKRLEDQYDLDETSRNGKGHGSTWAMIIHDFLDSIANDTEPPYNLFDSLHVDAIGWAAEKAMETGKTEEVVQFD